jgi:hypothetical protein
VQHLDCCSQVYERSGFGAEKSAGEQSQTRAETFPTSRDQLRQTSLERRAIRIHLTDKKCFNLFQPRQQWAKDSKRSIYSFDHIGFFGNNRKQRIKK